MENKSSSGLGGPVGLSSMRLALVQLGHQDKVGKAYGALLELSYQLGIDFTELLKELNAMDKALKDDPKLEAKKSNAP